jgi:hypothetical protein
MVYQWLGLKTTRMVSQFGLKTSGDKFPSLGLKIGSCSLVIWASKSPQLFLGLGLKTKWATVYQLRHKTDGRMKMAWGTRRDLAAFFTWMQVRLGFFSLASTPVEAWCG